MRRLAGLTGLLLAFVLALWSAAPALAEPTYPALTGRVVDDAHVLSARTRADLDQRLAGLEQTTSRQLVVVTVPSLGGYDIEEYGVGLLRKWGVGQKGVNNGVLFIVVPSEHKVRIEVGYGMEGVMTDALSSMILQGQVIPRFKSGDIEGGVVAGTDAIAQQMSADPSTAEQRLAQARQYQAPRRHHRNPLGGLIPLIIIVFVFSSLFRGRRGGWGWVLPFMFLSGGRGWRNDDWGGGGGGWGGGGGFSGGGGSGGGGGASGSW